MRARAIVFAGAALATVAALVAPLSAQSDSATHPAHRMGWGRETFLLSEVLEIAPGQAGRPVTLDAVGWHGGPVHRLWMKLDAAMEDGVSRSHGEWQALYGRSISPYWDLQLGLRADWQRSVSTRSRAGAVVGLQGLAPGWFELEPALFVTSDGVVSADLTATYDFYLAQRLVLQPRVEGSVSLRDDADFGVGHGLATGSFGARVRFEVTRGFAPYVGVAWDQRFGRTADLTTIAGDPTSSRAFVAGFRLWY